jgi:hypothetical protein
MAAEQFAHLVWQYYCLNNKIKRDKRKSQIEGIFNINVFNILI